MGDVRTLERLPRRAQAAAVEPAGWPSDRGECLKQLLLAFRDIADRDDIHQAAERLGFVQQWIRLEADRAAADPLFLDFPHL